MTGTWINVAAIMVGSLIGLFLKKGISEKLGNSLMQAVALCVVIIGISGSLKSEDMIITIISLALGALVGESIDIEKKMDNFAQKVENRFNNGKESGWFVRGFVTASLLFAVGAMAIVGSIESGLNANHEILITKSLLDFIASIVLTASLGVGVFFSAFVILIYQGSITLASTLMTSMFSTNLTMVITAMSAAGYILIFGLGLNMLKVTKLKIGNFVPAIFFPVVYYGLLLPLFEMLVSLF
ncbi:MAG: DUF554 domain-containing protein [Erysipelotrichaceae bacterium]|nr:DUF554 domain-containing protein [Erysipelotrichaceae bacterium]